jgi:hypothetical protein
VRAIAGTALLAIGCQSDQALKELLFEDIAVVTGDFDHMGEALVRMDIGYTEYEGFIAQSVYDPDIDPSLNALKVEMLLAGMTSDEKPQLLEYDAVFLNSGVRGLGSYVYNGVDPDDDFLVDPDVLDNIDAFMAQGRTMVLSDWAGDLIEAAWPDKIQFVNEGCDDPPCWDKAQVGTSETVVAEIVDEEMQVSMGTDSILLDFDFSYWTAMEEVASDVDVYLRGDIEYRISDSEGYGTIEDVPLLVGFAADRGRVVFSSFHWRAQNASVLDSLVLHAVDGLNPGSSASGSEESDEEE